MAAGMKKPEKGTTTRWFQVEFLSRLEEGLWIPLYGRSQTVEDARENRKHLSGAETRIVRIERTVEVIE